ncbi:MAG TPA: peptidylprolyl isomerase [Bryobacteraceae bacterium]|nr:peptidylprolyl isomerase [Bryobacteraceae bacterium]
MRFSEVAIIFAFTGLAAIAAGQQPPSSVHSTPKPEAGASAAPSAEVAPDAVVLTIGQEKITRAQFEEILAALAQNGHAATTSTAKRQVAEQYGALEAMAQAARSRKLDQVPEVKTMLAIQTDNILAQMLAKKLSDEAQLTDLDLRAYYNAHQKEFEEAQGSHILIRFKGSPVPLKPNEKDLTDAEALAKAQELRAKIVAGADFATIAKAESDDTGSASKGGELGTFRHGQMVAPFDDAAFTLPVGTVSEPVKTQFGYHIIKITSRTSKTFEEAKPELEKRMKPQMAREAVEKVRAQTPVTLNDEFFGK